MRQQTILVVDDEPAICWAFEKMLVADDHRVVTASSAEDGIRLAAQESPDVVVLDVRLPGQDGISAIPEFLKVTDNAPIIVITAFGDLETAVAAVKQGATDYLTKPFKLQEVSRACRNALEKSRTRGVPQSTGPMKLDHSVLVGASPAMQQVFRQIALVAESDMSVLISGETGTGKELVAAAIHRHSHRADQPYFAIAPVALNPDLIESELFGHAKGAFTHASDDRAGLFELAENGTVLLDEIGDLPPATQVKLLRVLEQGKYSRVGDMTPRSANVRILAATNCDLHESTTSGAFREDLFHRLTGMQIHLPPLRERVEDILPLCQHFLAAMDYPNFDSAMDEALLEQLQQRSWSGNIRELRNAIEHAAVLARGRTLTIEDFPPPKPGKRESSGSPTLAAVVRRWTLDAIENQDSDPHTLHAMFQSATEPTLLEVVLQHTGGNRAKAAEILGIHRGTLRDRLRTFGMDDQ